MSDDSQNSGKTVGRPFTPGVSGNPGGRPKGEREYLRRKYGEDAQALHERLDKLVAASRTPASVKATVLMWKVERHSGKARQAVEVTGPDGGPITIVHEYPGPAPDLDAPTR